MTVPCSHLSCSLPSPSQSICIHSHTYNELLSERETAEVSDPARRRDEARWAAEWRSTRFASCPRPATGRRPAIESGRTPPSRTSPRSPLSPVSVPSRPSAGRALLRPDQAAPPPLRQDHVLENFDGFRQALDLSHQTRIEDLVVPDQRQRTTREHSNVAHRVVDGIGCRHEPFEARPTVPVQREIRLISRPPRRLLRNPSMAP